MTTEESEHYVTQHVNTYIRCSCGWSSAQAPSPEAAKVVWAEHAIAIGKRG